MLAEVASAVAFRALHDGPSATGGGLNAEMRAGMAALGRQVTGAYRKTSDAGEANAPIPIASRRKQRPPN
jgi:hypothetical protein